MFTVRLTRLAAAVLLSVVGAPALAAGVAPKAEIIGTWRGVSVCVKSSEVPDCNDESVEYDVDDVDGGAVRLVAYRLFDGKRDWMFEMDFTYAEKIHSWTSQFENPRYHGLWTLTVAGDSMKGTLVDLASGHKARDVVARRDAAPVK